MGSDIKFSILVPVYKVEKYIGECIESVLGQSYPNFELVLVDDGSPDRSGEICDEYAAKDQRIRVFHKPNGGAMQTRCYALEKAQGDYCIIIDSDDYLALNTLEVLRDHILKTDADCIIYGFNWLKSSGTEVGSSHDAYANTVITDKNLVLNIILNNSAYNAMWRKCVRHSCFKGRDLSACYHIRGGDDRIQSEEVLENAESFLFIHDALYFYRVNDSSITHTINYDAYKANFTVEERSLALVEKLGLFDEGDMNRMRNFALDALVMELKRLSRFCSDMENSVMGLKSIRESEHYNDFLAMGYKKAPALPGIIESKGLRRMFNRAAIALLSMRAYRALVYFNKYIYR